MKTFAVVIILIGFGLFAWAIGSRLSTDAVGMGVGLVFGVLAGVPAALLLLLTGRRTDDGNEYEAGYLAGVRDTTDLARGMARQLPEHEPTFAEWATDYARQRAQQPPVIVVNPPATQYTMARPFAALTEALDNLPAHPPALVGEIVDNIDDWDYVPPRTERRFRIVGEVEP